MYLVKLKAKFLLTPIQQEVVRGSCYMNTRSSQTKKVQRSISINWDERFDIGSENLLLQFNTIKSIIKGTKTTLFILLTRISTIYLFSSGVF